MLRFVLFIPFSGYYDHASTHWNVIKHHPELSSGLYNLDIAAGEKIASKWATFGSYWNFAFWIPSLIFPPPVNLPFTVVDTVLTVYLSKATHYQTSYAPHSKAACAGAAYTWHRPAGANESFFEAAGRLNATVASPVDMCRSFTEEWQYGVTLSFFYALISALNILGFFGTLATARKRDESTKDLVIAILKMTLQLVLNIPKGVAFIIAGVLYFLPEFIFRCLPLSFKSKVRLGRRYAVKGGLAVEQKAELEIMELKDMYKQRKRQDFMRYQGGGGEQSPLSNFLGVYDMLIAVTEHLHYSDIMHLSCVSKSVREAVLPAHDLDHRLATFKRYSCSKRSSKQECWICDKQVCSVSYPITSSKPASTPTTNHSATVLQPDFQNPKNNPNPPFLVPPLLHPLLPHLHPSHTTWRTLPTRAIPFLRLRPRYRYRTPEHNSTMDSRLSALRRQANSTVADRYHGVHRVQSPQH